MTIETSQNKDVLKFSLTGRLDTLTAPDFEKCIPLLDSSIHEVVVDCTQLDYISSAGLRVLLMFRKKLGSEGILKVTGVNAVVKETLTMTGFSNMITVESSASDDVKAIHMTFRSFVEKKCAENADKEVFYFMGRKYTWNDIDRNSSVIARKLAEQGVKKRTHIAIFGMNTPNWIFTFFAVQKLGAIAVLMNFNLKPNEIAQLSHIGDVTHLCYGDVPGMMQDPHYLELLKKDSDSSFTHFFDMGSRIDFSSMEQNGIAVPEEYIEPDDPAVMIFTSGSTSLPKIVLLSAVNLFFCAQTVKTTLKQTADDTVCFILPLFHVFGLGVMVSSLFTDSVLYISDSYKGETIMKIVSEYRCTRLYSVPTLMIAIASNENLNQYDASSVKACYLAGAAISPSQLKIVSDRFTRTHFAIVYGMSELVFATCTRDNDTEEHIYHTIGIPADGVELKIQDVNTKQDCAFGQTGEILLKSPCQLVCYYKLDIDKQPIDENGWLHTGDLGWKAEDGYIHLNGRIKELIIRGGENIAPNEVINAIATNPAVADVKVVGVPSEFWGEEVAAGIILKPGASITDEELKTYLAPRLSKFKIPEYFVRYTSFPMLSNGKVDMTSLKQDIIRKVSASALRVH